FTVSNEKGYGAAAAAGWQPNSVQARTNANSQRSFMAPPLRASLPEGRAQSARRNLPQPLVSIVGEQAVAHAGLRDQVAGLDGIVLELAAKLLHVDAQ